MSELVYRKGNDENGNGKERRKQDVLLSVLGERVHNIVIDNQEYRRRYDDALKALDLDLTSMRQQTHDWMQKIVNRPPAWAVWVMTSGATALGAMLMWIITHAGGKG